ncbi:NAD(P)-dependent oxidoreductase [Pyruvatibacter sp.]|uniref:NAD(P)-dependent oxidoreductase n=1 Tax=Pyruvatibacter sp. TaxID=1981328 RepID=UPI0032EC9D10
MARVAFIGLGVMGYPMAGHLAKAGHQVTVYNRTTIKAKQWREAYKGSHGGSGAWTPAKAAAEAEVVFTCVGNDDDLRSVTLGPDGVFQTMQPGTVFVDHTTASADIARELAAEADKRGFGAIDAPVSGGQAGAENGQLTIMCGGDPYHYKTAEPIMSAYAKQSRLLGPAGSGQLTKMVNQICIGGLVQGLSEAIHFAQKADLDVAGVMDVISKGAAQSWQMENRWETMNEGKFDFGFAVDWMRKDLAICLAEAARNGADLPVTQIVDGYYADVQEMGGNRWDTSSLIARLTKS